MRSRPTTTSATRGDAAPAEKTGLHPRNRHRERYDFAALIAACPALRGFVARNRHGDDSIDFADPRAVRTLNQALLKHGYGLEWRLPEPYLCPPIPGRADYLHHAADLLAADNRGVVPRGAGVRVIDVGVGANCIYPLIGQREYGWSFLGSECDPAALAAAQRIVRANPGLDQTIELRLQPAPAKVFDGLVRPGELFDLTLCNPPFHASRHEAEEGARRKWRNLGRRADDTGKDAAKRRPSRSATQAPALNFGGTPGELWCAGGEVGFIRRMIRDSAALRGTCLWFSTLVAKEPHLAVVLSDLRKAGAKETRTIVMAHGQKQGRCVAWSFFPEAQRQEWRRHRWR